MTIYWAIGGFILVYLALVGRAAWKTGELAQFLRSLAIVVVLIAAIIGIVEGWSAFSR